MTRGRDLHCGQIKTGEGKIPIPPSRKTSQQGSRANVPAELTEAVFELVEINFLLGKPMCPFT